MGLPAPAPGNKSLTRFASGFFSVSTHRQLHRFTHPAEHFYEGIDPPLSRFLVHCIGHPWPRDHQELRSFSLFQVMVSNPGRQLLHELLLEQLGGEFRCRWSFLQPHIDHGPAACPRDVFALFASSLRFFLKTMQHVQRFLELGDAHHPIDSAGIPKSNLFWAGTYTVE